MDKKRLVDGTTALAEKRPRVIKIESAERPQNVRLRVAAYTRVSSDSEDQLNSFAAQNRYYTELISGKAEWRMVDIYADEGITGTSVAKRDDFQRMMADCRRGLIDQILVKSISRFARNTKDCLQNIRELKELGVNVRFERESIDTVNVSSERYTGEKGYPKLIDEEQLIAANEKRSNKPQLPKKTEAQKVLRRLCGTPPSEQVEQSVTDLLNGLANYPDRIQHRRSPTPVTYSKTQEALDNALEQQPIDEDNAKTLILQLAAEQYAALGDEEYETNRLRRLFSAFECVAELNADLLKNTVSEVLVTRQNVKLRLKNGQVIERSDLQ